MTDDSAVAVVGMSGRFPGARDLAEFWRNLRDGVCSIADFTEEELLEAGVPAEQLRDPRYVRSKGHLDDADRFEVELFGFTRAEATALDPQHRLLLETAWSALEDAGHDPRRVPDRTGVYVGGGFSEHMIAAHADPGLSAQFGGLHLRTLTDREFLAGWLAYRLGLNGPALTVQTSCSTSLSAVHLAVQGLLVGECDTALAGGVCVDSVRKRGYLYQPGGILSPDGRCRPFDERSSGTAPGNGVGLVVLRRLEDALADGDPVWAVIRGTALTNDGSAKVGFTAPSVDRQAAAIVEAWAAAGLDPARAQFLEAHGTATELGDRIELAAAASAFRGASRCVIGSVKSNVGHLDAAAGVAGLIKVVLMLAHRTMAPTANVTRPHPDLGLDTTPFRLLTSAAPWEADGPRLAGVTSVGIGGTNVHVVVEEAPPVEAVPRGPAPAVVLPISARTREQVATAARRLAAVLRSPDAPDVRDVAHTLATGRARLEERAYVVADDPLEAAAALEALARSAGTAGGTAGEAATGTAGRTAAGMAGAGSGDAPRAGDVARAALRELGEAWVHGEDVDWPDLGGRRVRLPTYPFAGEPFGAFSLAAPAQAVPPQAPAGHLLEAVTSLLSATLGLTTAEELDKSYLAVGGDSLTAVFLVGRLREEFDLDVPVTLFLEELPLRELARRVAVPEEDADSDAALLESLLEEIEERPSPPAS
ncbi:beta-ketoacyl synthase N-terminal-like domain-containing protein [Thermoactinospora rubra]|uniref:beta-ketoacyl synthase N-terminal-like domain-containing protein n=1 Tax=Thermoactinospora rubra TaxID=1088767 RepID=UPI000A11F5DB|nr:beta-ketoacyl synthase N-terminal-like domain-containing protein [Thermoactinospora rubra]